MTAFQAFWLGFVIVVFFGSIGLGLYLRRRDRLRDLAPPPTRPPHKTEPIGSALISTNDARLAMGVEARPRKVIPTPEEAAALVRVLEEYYAEVDRLCREYHRIAFHSTEDAAQAWLRKQTGQDKTP